MRVAIVQHSSETPPGTVTGWIESRGFGSTLHRMHSGNDLPGPADFDLLVLCGGGMNVDQEDRFPWLRPEKSLIRRALDEEKKIVGLCLGGQLLAEVLGARVERDPRGWETGWQPVQIQGPSPREIMAFQYHGYRFHTPAGARPLARNDWWDHQAFQWHDRALGFQFHPETDLEWNRECAADPDLPVDGPGRVQSRPDILRLGELHQNELRAWFWKELDRFAGVSGPR